ncbi:domain of Kin17 curved DNA-binding protein-domain-containing protein [Dipodascopsis tothii]|uniref:domain of Kin17 curved DNA-binding protein-domain-containing protein n=1 Tax=Dipodascopsis tothii TaxID=44089 RepID=UPI0034CD461A
MPRAEFGTPKYVANKMKSKGLQRLRWYCQVCEKQCRDENGFRCHTQSESHVRQMLIVGENPQRKIAEYSAQFKRDFLTLLRSSHGEKPVNFNKFYQEYISDKNHVHMNATRWASLTEFVTGLGIEGTCKVEVDPDKPGAFTIAWIDNTPEALMRRKLAMKRERIELDDLSRDQKMLQQQVQKAMEQKQKTKEGSSETEEGLTKELQREEGEKIKLSMSFAMAKKPTKLIGRPKPKKLV